MQVKTISIVICFLAFAFIAHSVRQFKNNQISIKDLSLWAGIWILIGFFALFPQYLDVLMRTTMMKDRMTFLLVSSSVLLYVLLFRINLMQKKAEKRLTRLIQEIALRDYGGERKLEQKKD